MGPLLFQSATIIPTRAGGSMASLDLAVLCDPITHAPLELRANALLSGTASYRLAEASPSSPLFLRLSTSSISACMTALPRSTISSRRLTSASSGVTFEPSSPPNSSRPHMRVLEVSIGTGANLRLLPPGAEIHGLDLSMGMLRACRRNLRRAHREATLYQGEAERLPFSRQLLRPRILRGRNQLFQ